MPQSRSIRYVAFLRGINVGGAKVVKMDQLKREFDALNFTGVKSVLASGNILFTASSGSPTKLTKQIESHLQAKFQKSFPVVLRTIDGLQELADSKPFRSAKISATSIRQVTFFADGDQTRLTAPCRIEGGCVQVTHCAKDLVCAVVDVSAKYGTTEWMKYLSENFGNGITTRTWATIEKVLKATDQSE